MKKLCMILSFALILCFTFGCQDKEAMAELEAMKAQAEVEEQNKEIILKMIELMNSGNFAELDTVISKDCIIHYPGGQDVIGLEAFLEHMKVGFAPFSDLEGTQSDLIAERDKVFYRLTLVAAHQGEFMGSPATGKRIKWTQMELCHISDGKIVEWWVEQDNLGFMQQLGMELKPKEAKK